MFDDITAHGYEHAHEYAHGWTGVYESDDAAEYDGISYAESNVCITAEWHDDGRSSHGFPGSVHDSEPYVYPQESG